MLRWLFRLGLLLLLARLLLRRRAVSASHPSFDPPGPAGRAKTPPPGAARAPGLATEDIVDAEYEELPGARS